MSFQKQVSLKDMQRACGYAALLAAQRGHEEPAFVEAFEAIERLVKEREAKEGAIERARRLAGLS